ncbi:sulfatase-like hydrolase/transferase [Brevibacillus composti]|uniref:Sulfatase-like hydrolase/transferase n=1 Tax=Brevibacillus composti TaxID=2796470 RepID=A0A7T5EKN7_9BACL|nr:sulfatase-like hydrolase/transferase [Brevibacillus composti]QQE74389.1 sulfatase-like hydrolase/transferase [Brevibacillus composti]QUO41471.1 sulfatase-like hydrolase/transferase [Brevibacillus composti]
MNHAQTSAFPLEKPNFLVLLVDEQRYPPVYESPEIRAWCRENLLTQQLLRTHGVEFHRHYIGSSACSPSRATLLTGQYPSLHGVTQTTGIAKEPFDSDVFWLDHSTVPTMGDYFRAAGYQTYYKGKWHISYEDILIPGTHQSIPSYDPATGVPDPQKEDLYLFANRLDNFGFSGWVGPEPHGGNPRNSGSSAAIGLRGRDEVYAAEAVSLIEALDRQKRHNPDAPPWLIVASFVNPHDIVLYGALTAQLPLYRFELEPMPDVPPPPTITESLRTKPRCQASYRDLYPLALQPIIRQEFYRQLYYQLQKNADREMYKVFEALTRSSFYDNTIVIFTSDHGELLGAHGGLHQKWYCAYEEVLRVPLLIHNRQLFPRHRHVHALTSHVDLLPTMLGLAHVDPDLLQDRLRGAHSDVRPFVGRDLTPYLREERQREMPNEPIFFMTDDDPTRGQHQLNPLGVPYPSVIQPNHIESVIAVLHHQGKEEWWKFSRYFDHPQFWRHPGIKDETSLPVPGTALGQETCWVTRVKTRPEPEEYELYCLTNDPLEVCNLASPAHATEYTRRVQAQMMELLNEQRKRKRLVPG